MKRYVRRHDRRQGESRLGDKWVRERYTFCDKPGKYNLMNFRISILEPHKSA